MATHTETSILQVLKLNSCLPNNLAKSATRQLFGNKAQGTITKQTNLAGMRCRIVNDLRKIVYTYLLICSNTDTMMHEAIVSFFRQQSSHCDFPYLRLYHHIHDRAEVMEKSNV